MKKTKLSTAVKATLLGASIAFAPAAFSANMELLEILKANGAITAEQFTELSKVDAKAAKSMPSEALLKKMAWAGKIKIKGDLRLRQEFKSGSKTDDRQRVRARIGIYADVADNVQAGLRLATGYKSTTGNQSLEDNFNAKDIFLDLAYLNWQPLEGLNIIGGKFQKPWQKVSGGLIWDGDLNPEGLAAVYTTQLGGVQLITSAGHLVQSEGSNDTVSEDAKVTYGQIAAKLKIAGAKTKVGVSLFDFDEQEGSSLFSGGGNDTDMIKLTQVFAETTVDLGVPVKFYADYVVNNDADGVNSGEDTAWLLGAQVKSGKWKASYDYRETELNAVNGAFNDGAFANGQTDSEGSAYKLAYTIDKNFSVSTSYLDAKVNDLGINPGGHDVWQIDLNAKF